MTQALARRILSIVVVVFLIGSIAGSILGQPIFLTYVETDSMSPTLEPNDGFIAIPYPVAGSIDRGDVIVFDAQYLHDGGLVTHRVIDKTDDGYITRGDANPFPDQSVGEPPVNDRRIVATALQINGELIVIPSLGTYATTIRDAVDTGQRSLAATTGIHLFLGLEGLVLISSLLIVVLYSLFSGGISRDRTRTRARSNGTKPHFVVLVLVLTLLSGATMTMVLSAETQTYEVRADTTENATYMLSNGVVPSTVFLESETDGISPQLSTVRLGVSEHRNVSVFISSSPGGVGASRKLTEYRYPSVLPAETLQWLHSVHPWLAIAGVDVVLGFSCYLFCLNLVGTSRLRDRSRTLNRSSRARIRRIIRLLY